jgi:ATP-dependent DNA helicase RecG
MIAGGLANIVVGTHALIQDKVRFQKLGLVVVDEQHRFGVEQRSQLKSKGIRPHMLLMSATPIPRSLRLAQLGDLDTSTLRELPGGARQVATAIRTEPDRHKIYNFVIEQARQNGKIFIVCPLIDESEKQDTEAAVAYHKRVSSGPLSGVNVGLLHGRMSGDDKQRAINLFRSGETPVLVATPVIEVGVDVPDASVMIIENAERFGLAALHQLRGRVGRQGQKAYFILIPGPKMTLEAEARLKILVETSDGFQIAERDLETRGAGEFFGTRQSGEFELRYSNPVRDQELLAVAAEHARLLIERDPDLTQFPILRGRFQARYAHRLAFPDAG